MAKIIFFDGNLINNENSFSKHVTNFVYDEYVKNNPGDEILRFDLNETHSKLFLNKNNIATYWQEIEADKWIDLLKSADKVVLSCSMTNFGPTVVVKNFIDSIAVANKTFSYKYSKKGEAIGLLNNLKVLIIASQGAPRDWYTWGSHIEWLKGTWNFLGANKVETIEIAGTKVEPVSKMTPEEYLKSKEAELKQVVKNF